MQSLRSSASSRASNLPQSASVLLSVTFPMLPLLAPPCKRTRQTRAKRQHGRQGRRDPTGVRSLSTSSSSAPQSSVSSTETTHFSHLASSWWDPHGPSRLLHLMNPLRHAFIESCLCTNTPSAPQTARQELHYLDVGCGGGIFSESAARLPGTASVTGIDPTPSVIQVAKQHARTDPALSGPASKLKYLNLSIEDLPLANNNPKTRSPPPPPSPAHDILTLFEVLEHITHPSPFLSSCTKHLRPGGWLIGSTISRSPLSYLTTKLIAEMPVFGLVPAGTHTWSQFIRPAELERWFSGKTDSWGPVRLQAVVYVPGLGWRMVGQGALGGLVEGWGNYFFGVQKRARD